MSGYDKYLKICKEASDNQSIFNGFKSNPRYNYVLEQGVCEHGRLYYEHIKENHPELLKIDTFFDNDRIGNPYRYFYDNMKDPTSPTTLSYIKILGDLITLFDDLNQLDIIEIGGGYGGQCKIIHDYCTPRSYTIIDLPEVLMLIKKYTSYFENIKNLFLFEPKNVCEKRYDLLISNYAFSEINIDYQNIYIDKIIKNTDMGYMICNRAIPPLMKDGMVIDEYPLTCEGNFTYIWGVKK